MRFSKPAVYYLLAKVMDLSLLPYTELSEDWLYCEEPFFPLPVNVKEYWRPFPPKKRHACTLRGIEKFGNFTPLWTNGIMAIVLRITGKWEFVHLDNIDWSFGPSVLFADNKPPAKNKPKKQKGQIFVENVTLEQLLGF